MGLKQHMVNHVLCLLPETRCYSLKVRLFRFAGVEVARGARLTSSIRVIGAMSLAIGEDSFIGHHVLLAGGPSRIRIGRYVDIAPRVCIVAGTHEIDMRGDHSAGEGKSGDRSKISLFCTAIEPGRDFCDKPRYKIMLLTIRA